jgi:hypothetical protein
MMLINLNLTCEQVLGFVRQMFRKQLPLLKPDGEDKDLLFKILENI